MGKNLKNLRSSECRYCLTNGKSKEYLFCGELTENKSSFCPEHKALCTREPTEYERHEERKVKFIYTNWRNNGKSL
jgi:hypothetical protein